MTIEEKIDAKIEELNSLHKELQELKKEHPECTIGYVLSPGGILNAYREGDISFDKAVELLSRKEKIKLFVVTCTIDYEIEEQYAYISEAEAKRKYDELCEKKFRDAMEQHVENNDCEEELLEPADYQYTTCWWDDDCRVKVFMREVEVEITQ